MREEPFVVACIPAYDEERMISGVLVRTLRYVYSVVVCDDGSRDLTSCVNAGSDLYVDEVC